MAHLGTRLHTAVYRLSRGRALGRMGGEPVLLLSTVGRHSGRTRTTPLQYLPAEAGYVVVASARGAPRPPAWWLNLRAHPTARVQVGGSSATVHAREAVGAERARLWAQLTAANRWLERAAAKAGRELPVVLLERDEPPR